MHIRVKAARSYYQMKRSPKKYRARIVLKITLIEQAFAKRIISANGRATRESIAPLFMMPKPTIRMPSSMRFGAV